MYVGPWQEYRLGQMFNEQTRIIADAVRQQVQAQIRAEQAAQPQVQLQPHPKHHSRAGGNGSYSNQLRAHSYHPSDAQYSSVASTINSPSNSVSRGRSSGSRSAISSAHSSSSSAYAPSHRTNISSAASLHHATPSALSSSSAKAAAAAILPPLQAAARAAVESMQASRVRATVNHPLAHIVSSYLPDTVTTPDALSRQSSQASSASSAASSSAAIAANNGRIYLGGNPALNYRPPPHAIPRLKKPNNSRLNANQVAQAHREHIGKLRALYNLQTQNADNAQSSSQSISQAASEAGTPVHAASSSAAERLPSLPQLPQHAHAHAASPSNAKPYVLPAAVMPQLSATSLALYGPIPDELAASLSFYAVPAAQAEAAAAAKRIANRLPKEEIEDVSSSAHQQQQQQQQQYSSSALGDVSSPYASLDAASAAGQRNSRPSSRDHSASGYHTQLQLQPPHQSHWPRSDARSNGSNVRPSSRGHLLSPLAHPPSSAAASLHGSNILPQKPPQQQQLHVSHSNSSGKLHHLPAAISPSNKKLSAERQWMAQQQQQQQAVRSASALSDDSSRLHTPMLPATSSQTGFTRGSRLSTPLLHTHGSSRAQLHSSGGLSDAGFEHEVDDLLGWAAEITAKQDDDSLADNPGARQVMQVHG